ncbi:alpha/beta fold hydrolase [Rhizobium leguminosarum]|uniref:alpha/beta fold hydrolase n=1 Tax=Rhizobium TaxID=379 RepID=UPI0010325B95|nr:alpha/beta hydrolase [Rhizobium leguminosarum]TBF81946.1 alpha/beta hydrolase [Rhizobium leguminosarum]TBH01436.1 alpha/beta hydrolase [Rhizobium leguminosarum]TBH10973.1 alpha/beta hydrolase [Rhizobium leguminosarum]TBH35716.1 alpha/beta hydrolase [Rhizobium leguminosarum]TBH66171.1 alpha/beta hydrolase [Rhizobium leguminosarum]
MSGKNLELLLLHALPLDGSMWAAQLDLLPGATYAPTLYGYGDRVEDWAAEAIKLPKGDQVIVVGCSVGGSCALEVAALAPERVAALVLIGTKAVRRPDPALQATAVETLREQGLEAAWREWWEPAFSASTSAAIIAEAKRILMRQQLNDVIRGVEAFHTRRSRGDILSTFSGPVHVVTGAEDVLPGLMTSSKQAELAQNSCLHVIPECGHYVSMERPETLNSLIRQLIKQIET